jgi:archaellum component FlaC
MKLTPYVSNNHDADGVSLLMIAIDSKAFHVAKYLIDKGIDSNIRDSNGKTALDYFNMINENNVPEDFQDDYMYVKNKLEGNMDQNGGNIISGMMDSFSNQFQQIQDKINMVKNNIETVKNNIETVKNNIETVKQLISNPELINDMVLIFKNNPNNAIKLVKENENYKNIYNIIDKVIMNSTSKNAMIKTLNTIKQIKDSVNNPAIKIILDVNPELNIPLTIIKKHAQILDNIKLLIDKISNIHQNTMTTRGGGKYKKGKSRRRKGKKQKTKKQTKRRKYKKGKSRKRKYKNNYRVKQNK